MSKNQKIVPSKNLDKNTVRNLKLEKPEVEQKKLIGTSSIKSIKQLSLKKEELKKTTTKVQNNVEIKRDVKNVKTKSSLSKSNTKTVSPPTTKKVPPSTTKTIQASTKKTEPLSTTKKVQPKISVATNNVEKKVRTPIQSTTSTNRTQPMKAKPITGVIVSSNNNNNVIVGKNNIMNQIHNVTVLSPPLQRKDIQEIITISPTHKMRERTRTRTLEPHEVLILKNVRDNTERDYKSLELMFGKTIDTNHINSDSLENETILPVEKIKEPIAFEINFDEKNQKPSTSNQQKITNIPVLDEYDYEDDFDSYESDFESGSSTKSVSQLNSANEEISSTSTSSESESESSLEDDNNAPAIHDKLNEKEKKLDSGNYELRNRQDNVQVENSITERQYISEEQNDSGLEYSGGSNLSFDNSKNKDIISDTDVEFSVSVMSFQPDNTHNNKIKKNIKPKLSKRGQDLVGKIQLDVMTFSLFELKPMTYEYYMKIYGYGNSMQNSTQTNEDTIEQDTQTEIQMCSSVWTQFPPVFSRKGLNEINKKMYYNERNGVGQEDQENDKKMRNLLNGEISESFLEKSIKFVEELDTRNKKLKIPCKEVDYERLNILLQRTAVTISDILNKSSKKSSMKKSHLNFSQGYFSLKLNHSLIKDTKIKIIYTDVMIPNILLTLHNVNCDKIIDYENFICVWNILDSSNPIKILSCWGKITCLSTNTTLTDIIFGGMIDGSLAIWDLRESSFWHPSIDDCTIRVSSQLVMPDKSSTTDIIDYGRLISIKNIRHTSDNGIISDYNPIQICTLHEFGIITIWTILDTKLTDLDTGQSGKITINISPWSHIRLVQSSFLDLCSQLTRKNKVKTNFEKTRLYFENDIFSDDILKELQNNGVVEGVKNLLTQNLRFTDFEVTGDGFFIGTNKNFIYFCLKSMKLGQCKKIVIDEGNCLFTTSLKLFPNEKFLTVGLSNGSIKIYSCSVERPVEIKFEQFAEQMPSTSNATTDSQDALIISKSCAIQNIIEGERKMYDESQALNNLDSTELKNRLTFVTELKKSDAFINDQLLLSGFSVKGSSVRNIQITKDGKILFAVVGNVLKFYDLIKNQEIDLNEKGGFITDIGITENVSGRKHLIILSMNEIQVHQIKHLID